MIEMKNDVLYSLVYSLVTLTLILPVATATVERVFSVMNIIKSWLQNRMRDQWMYDCLVTYIEKCVYIYIYIQDYWVWRNHVAVSKYEKSLRTIDVN